MTAEAWHLQQLAEKDREISEKDEQIEVLQKRLQRLQAENDDLHDWIHKHNAKKEKEDGA